MYAITTKNEKKFASEIMCCNPFPFKVRKNPPQELTELFDEAQLYRTKTSAINALRVLRRLYSFYALKVTKV